MPLSDVSLIVTAGHRPGYLKECLNGIIKWLPETTTVVITDDDKDSSWFNLPEKTIWENVPLGTFLTRKRNLAVRMVDTKYTVLLADDFLVDADLRRTIIRMHDILELHRTPDLVAGTFSNRDWQGYLTVVEGEYIQETMLDKNDMALVSTPALKLWKVDLTPNAFMARTSMMKQVPWDETIGPIGGEHADWFLDLKAAGKVVSWTEGLHFREQEKNAEMEASWYGEHRRRSVWQGHALMLKKRGVKRYIGFGEKP